MNEIYLATRLDYITAFLSLIAVLSFGSIIVLSCIAFFNKNDADIHNEDSKPWKRHIDAYKRCLYWSKRCVIVFFVSIFINIFIPTTNEALLIYGLGGTIEYIKSNDTAKQLPDKCIKALDKYLDNITKEENQKYNNNESK